MRLRAVWGLIKETFSEWHFKEVSLLAGSLAYYTVFSLAPLLVIAIAIVGFFFGQEEVQGKIIEQLQEIIGSRAAGAIETAIANTKEAENSQGFFTIPFNIALLVFGASNIFVRIQRALDRIWEVKPEPERNIFHFIRKRVLSFAMMLAIAVLLLAYWALDTILSWFIYYTSSALPGFGWIGGVLDLLLFLTVITLLVALIYKILPDARVAWRDAFVGAMVTALLFAIGQLFFGLFLEQTDLGSTYGVAGSLVILLAWVYYCAHILLLGGEFTQVYARRRGDRIVPSAFAVRVSPYYDSQSQQEREENLSPETQGDRQIQQDSDSFSIAIWRYCNRKFYQLTESWRRR